MNDKILKEACRIYIKMINPLCHEVEITNFVKTSKHHIRIDAVIDRKNSSPVAAKKDIMYYYAYFKTWSVSPHTVQAKIIATAINRFNMRIS